MTYSNSWYKKEYLLGLTGMGGGAAGILVGGGPISSSDEDAYQIAKSLRFNQADTTYLTSSPPAGGNRKKWTWAGWVKRSNVLGGVIDVFWEARTSGSSLAMFQFNTDDKFVIFLLIFSFFISIFPNNRILAIPPSGNIFNLM